MLYPNQLCLLRIDIGTQLLRACGLFAITIENQGKFIFDIGSVSHQLHVESISNRLYHAQFVFLSARKKASDFKSIESMRTDHNCKDGLQHSTLHNHCSKKEKYLNTAT